MPSVTSGTYSPGPAIGGPPAAVAPGGSVYGDSTRTLALLVLQSHQIPKKDRLLSGREIEGKSVRGWQKRRAGPATAVPRPQKALVIVHPVHAGHRGSRFCIGK